MSESERSGSLPMPRRRASSSMSETRKRHEPLSRNARTSRRWAFCFSSSALMPMA